MPYNPVAAYHILFLIMLSLIILCFAIVNTHERIRQKYEADFARDIVASGRGHYQKMNEQYDALRILRHDYKFHLNTAIDMLRRGEIEKSDYYLNGLKLELAEKELPDFCENPVINSLAADYAQRCAEMEIKLDVSIDIPKGASFSNYEMCIVLGNLLENAVEACQKLEKTGLASADSKPGDKKPDRIIELVVKRQGEQLAIMVRNTFDGKVVKDGEQLVSTKKDGGGGFGLRSVEAVVDHSGETFFTEYDDKWFNVYVLWKVNEE